MGDFTSAEARELMRMAEAAVKAALNDDPTKRGRYVVSKVRGKYGNEVQVTVTITSPVMVARDESRKRESFRMLAGRYGLEPDDLGRTFWETGRAYTIEGIKPQAPKYPIVCRRSPDGKVFRFPADRVSGALARERNVEAGNV